MTSLTPFLFNFRISNLGGYRDIEKQIIMISLKKIYYFLTIAFIILLTVSCVSNKKNNRELVSKDFCYSLSNNIINNFYDNILYFDKDSFSYKLYNYGDGFVFFDAEGFFTDSSYNKKENYKYKIRVKYKKGNPQSSISWENSEFTVREYNSNKKVLYVVGDSKLPIYMEAGTVINVNGKEVKLLKGNGDYQKFYSKQKLTKDEIMQVINKKNRGPVNTVYFYLNNEKKSYADYISGKTKQLFCYDINKVYEVTEINGKFKYKVLF